jgi:hypothetical protein
MFHKFLNISTGKTFIAGPSSKKHYQENKAIKYIGTCNEDGTMILFDNSPPPVIPEIDKETRKQINNVLPKKSHDIEENFSTSDEMDDDI